MRFFLSLAGLSLSVLFSGCGGIDRMHAVDVDPRTGFAVYRSGQPKAENADELCKMGIGKIFALNGEANQYASALAGACPKAQIVYDTAQDPDSPLSRDFLDLFDRTVAEAKATGDRILFHCSCGCHRTGRLAAYYRMKYLHWSADRAIQEMNELGRDMETHPTLPAQVRALEDYALARACGQDPKFCIQ